MEFWPDLAFAHEHCKYDFQSKLVDKSLAVPRRSGRGKIESLEGTSSCQPLLLQYEQHELDACDTHLSQQGLLVGTAQSRATTAAYQPQRIPSSHQIPLPYNSFLAGLALMAETTPQYKLTLMISADGRQRGHLRLCKIDSSSLLT